MSDDRVGKFIKIIEKYKDDILLYTYYERKRSNIYRIPRLGVDCHTDYVCINGVDLMFSRDDVHRINDVFRKFIMLEEDKNVEQANNVLDEFINMYGGKDE